MAKGRWKVGIALGAGSARGLAHIGVLKVFEREGIPIDFIAGSSIGAVVGVCYASGKAGAKDVEGLVYNLNWRYIVRLMTLFMPKFRVPEPEEVLVFLESRLKGMGIEELPIPTAVVATDLFSGERVVFRSGDMFTAVSASIAIPGVFSPVYFEGRFLIDGGVVDPIPVDVVREMGAEVVIGVDVSPRIGLRLEKYRRRRKRLFSLLFRKRSDKTDLSILQEKKSLDFSPPPPREVLLQAIDIMFRRITEDVLARSRVDMVIRPKVDDVQSNAFNKAPEIVRLGEEAAYAVLPELKRMISKRWYHYIVGKRALNASI